VKVPEGWRSTRIGAEVATYSGGTPRRDESSYYGGDIPWIKSGELNGGAVFSTSESITKEGLRNSSARMVEAGTLLLALYGATAGVPAISHIDAAINQAILAIRPMDTLDRMYLYHWLCMSREAVVAKYTQGGQPNLSADLVRSLRISLPPLPEQRKIAEILGTWDEAIALVERRLAAARARKRGLMQRLLTGQVRFPGFTEPWREVRLGELGHCLRGVSYKPDDLRATDGTDTVRLLRANNIVTDGLDLTSIQIVDAARAKKAQFLRAGDIAICMSSGSHDLVGKASAYHDSDGQKYVVGAFCAIYRPLRRADASLVEQIFQSEVYRRQILVLGAGTNIRNLKPSDIEGIMLRLPSVPLERERIAAVLGTCDAKIGQLTAKLTALQAQKKGLMQRLLTGEVRVRV